jgi:uncharacterized SAM-binding protein YcdF (DUF218 family)
MFFLLSKTVGFLIVPSSLLAGIGLLGLILMATRFNWIGRRLLVACVVSLLICGFSPLGDLLLVPLETRFPPWDPSRGEPYGIIVLGGGIDPDLSLDNHTTVFTDGSNQFIAAAELGRRYPSALIVYAGGSANLISDQAREADYAIPAFQALGIPRERLIIERRSRNTEENAEFSKEIVGPKPGQRWLLVTSAFHMPRSVGIFRKVGFPVEPYPVDWRTRGRSHRLRFSSSFLSGMSRTEVAAREWIGLFAYWLTGKSSDLFPRPT